MSWAIGAFPEGKRAMTEQLVLDLLVTLGIHRVTRDEGTRRYVLHFVRDGRAETTTVTDHKREHQEAISDLEEEKQTVL